MKPLHTYILALQKIRKTVKCFTSIFSHNLVLIKSRRKIDKQPISPFVILLPFCRFIILRPARASFFCSTILRQNGRFMILDLFITLAPFQLTLMGVLSFHKELHSNVNTSLVKDHNRY